MTLFVRKLCRSRGAWTLLRLCDGCSQPGQPVCAPSVCKFGTLAFRPRHTWELLRNARGCIVSAARQKADMDRNGEIAPATVKENVFARNLFLNSVKYAQSVIPASTTHAYVTNDEAMQLLYEDWNAMTEEQLLSTVKKLSYNVLHSKKNLELFMYQNAFNILGTRFSKLTNNTLLTMMRYLIPFKRLKDNETNKRLKCSIYEDLAKQLNRQCVERFLQLRTNDILLLCDMLYEMGYYGYISDYMWYAVRKLGNKPQKLSPEQLIQLLFFLNVCRKPPINMYEIEYSLEQCLDEISINELGIAALGFFKTGTKIKNGDFLIRIIRKTIDNIEIADTVAFGAIIKLIRYSMQIRATNELKMLSTAMLSQEPRFTLMTLSHLAHACTRVQVYNKELMDRIIERLNSEMKSARLKEFERLIFVISSFNIDASNSVYSNVIEELRTTWNTTRAEEIEKYPFAITRLLRYLSHINIYPLDLIERIMMPKYVHNVSSGYNHHIPAEYCVLDCSLQVEVPEYNGPFLKLDIRNFLLRKHFLKKQITDETRMNSFLNDVLKTCRELFNNTSDIVVDWPLPYYMTPDIILCLDEQNRLIPLKKFVSSFKDQEIKYPNKQIAENARWIALVIGTEALMIKDTSLYTGILAAKIRHLSAIGYIPLVISHIDWITVKHKPLQEKCDFIADLLFKNNTKID